MSPAGLLLVILLVCVAVGLMVHHSPQQGRKRERQAFELLRRQEAFERELAQQWMEAVAYCQSHAHAGLAHVIHVYGAYPQRGTKAVLRWWGGDGAPQDAWFELAWPRTGDWLVVTGGAGYGRHNDNPDTFYAFIVCALPPGAWEAWQRLAAAGPLPAAASPRG